MTINLSPKFWADYPVEAEIVQHLATQMQSLNITGLTVVLDKQIEYVVTFEGGTSIMRTPATNGKHMIRKDGHWEDPGGDAK